MVLPQTKYTLIFLSTLLSQVYLSIAVDYGPGPLPANHHLPEHRAGYDPTTQGVHRAADGAHREAQDERQDAQPRPQCRLQGA